jgi:hypothetical protein
MSETTALVSHFLAEDHGKSRGYTINSKKYILYDRASTGRKNGGG